MHAHIYLSVYLFGGYGVWTQDFALTRQASTTWAILPALFVLVILR
jgi:hypothetical protein